MLNEITMELSEKNINISFSDEVKEYILEKGYDAKYGARPLRRLITTAIEDELADMYLRGEIKDGDVVMVDCKNNKLNFVVKSSVDSK